MASRPTPCSEAPVRRAACACGGRRARGARLLGRVRDLGDLRDGLAHALAPHVRVAVRVNAPCTPGSAVTAPAREPSLCLGLLPVPMH